MKRTVEGALRIKKCFKKKKEKRTCKKKTKVIYRKNEESSQVCG
jgi:hypothetical protein